jgi:hypothetical protein
MPFPFLLWSTHLAFTESLRADRDWWRDEALAAQQRERDVMARLIEAAKEATPQPVPRVKREPDEADTAIDWRAQGDPAMRRHLERYAKAQRREGMDPKDIAKLILQGDAMPDDEDGLPI